MELPAPVLELEGPSYRREEKLRRTRKITNSEENIPKIQQKLIDTPSPEILSENGIFSTIIAMKYVASSDPQSQMESEIDNFIREKRIIRDELKKKITIERRIELAKRKISKVDKWAGIEDGEDISKQLRGINHGLTVISESKVTDSSIPYGISYVRIDHQRILKVRMPLKIDTPSNDAKLSNNNLDPTPNLILPNPARAFHHYQTLRAFHHYQTPRAFLHYQIINLIIKKISNIFLTVLFKPYGACRDIWKTYYWLKIFL